MNKLILIVLTFVAIVGTIQSWKSYSYIQAVEQSRMKSHYSLMHDGTKCVANTTEEADECTIRTINSRKY